MISYEIIISTTEYRNDVSVRTDTSVWHRRYKSRKTAERKAAEMCETIAMKSSPVKYITTAEVRP
ncbi:TPA: hypothetical protein ACH58E_005614 [Escherichia coli]|uniref:Uncharacterized protein n=1 Tax=Escherichia coli TaxID=562 RepID=A0A7D7KAG5_ECOLX|nr:MULTISPECIES: hypothetical protein [Escherichia]EIG48216.1 hypothetical protein ESTG_01255 [Escherichia coli B799]EFF3781538.1 hypothetical protein [Escherichia coli]QLW51305.1 hypothetical protein HV246_16090 [Escherichia marmotae]QMS36932.1 hypothetical protein HVV39_02365 [Escherichia coli]SQM17970.1 Uncharacterised protein [Escherichia coli]